MSKANVAIAIVLVVVAPAIVAAWPQASGFRAFLSRLFSCRNVSHVLHMRQLRAQAGWSRVAFRRWPTDRIPDPTRHRWRFACKRCGKRL